MYPFDAVTGSATQATAISSILVPTTTTPLYIYHYVMSTATASQQQIQCRTNLSTFKTLYQVSAAGFSSTDYRAVLPANTVCYLKSFDSTLTHAEIIFSTSTHYNTEGVATSSVATSTPVFVPTLTGGEALISLFVFLGLCIYVGRSIIDSIL